MVMYVGFALCTVGLFLVGVVMGYCEVWVGVFVRSCVRMLVASGVPLLVSTVVSVMLVAGIRRYCWLCAMWWCVGVRDFLLGVGCRLGLEVVYPFALDREGMMRDASLCIWRLCHSACACCWACDVYLGPYC
jgi:hypothetical protein